MPVYKVQGPDGRIHKIDGPEGATLEQLVAVIQEQDANAPKPKDDFADVDF